MIESEIARALAIKLIGIYSKEEQGKKVVTTKYQLVNSVKVNDVYKIILRQDKRTHIATLSIYKARTDFQHPEYDNMFRRSHRVKRYKLRSLDLLQKNKETEKYERVKHFNDTNSFIEYIIKEIESL